MLPPDLKEILGTGVGPGDTQGCSGTGGGNSTGDLSPGGKIRRSPNRVELQGTGVPLEGDAPGVFAISKGSDRERDERLDGERRGHGHSRVESVRCGEVKIKRSVPVVILAAWLLPIAATVACPSPAIQRPWPARFPAVRSWKFSSHSHPAVTPDKAVTVKVRVTGLSAPGWR